MHDGGKMNVIKWITAPKRKKRTIDSIIQRAEKRYNFPFPKFDPIFGKEMRYELQMTTTYGYNIYTGKPRPIFPRTYVSVKTERFLSRFSVWEMDIARSGEITNMKTELIDFFNRRNKDNGTESESGRRGQSSRTAE